MPPPPRPKSKKKKEGHADKHMVNDNGLTVCAWNKDCSLIALSPNNTEVHIYKTNGSRQPAKWDKKPAHVLTEHTELVSGIDWCASTNFLVTCAHDRNAYVWEFDKEEEKYKPSLVIHRINRAATSVKWSPAGNKFAITSAAKVVPICYFEPNNKWWVSKALRKHKSTVLSVDWCCNNKFVVTGGTDYRCRVLSAFMKNLDSEEDDGFGEIWKKQHQFGEVLAEFDQAKAWVHGVAWSPSGFRIAFTGHGSTAHFVQIIADGDPIVTTYNHKGLPFTSCAFVSDGAVVATGYDCNPHLFLASGDEAEPTWDLAGKVDKEEKKAKKEVSSFAKAQNMWGAKASKGQSSAKKENLKTKHQNFISGISLFPDEEGVSTEFATIGIDGRLVKWNLEKAGFQI